MNNLLIPPPNPLLSLPDIKYSFSDDIKEEIKETPGNIKIINKIIPEKKLIFKLINMSKTSVSIPRDRYSEIYLGIHQTIEVEKPQFLSPRVQRYLKRGILQLIK